MPTVPHLDTFQSTPTTDPNVAFRMPDMPDAGAQAKQIGVATGQVADAAYQMQMDFQHEANRLRVIEASNQAKERMYDMLYDKDAGALNQKGWAALNRQSGKALPDEYADKLKEVTDGISGGLGNDMQRRMFQEQVIGMQSQMRGTLDQHLMGEFNRHKISTFDGTIGNESRAIALAGSSGNILVNKDTGLSNIDESAQTIMAAAREKARSLGLSQVEADTMARKALSNAHTLAVSGALESGKPEYAEAYMKKYTGQMDADDILRVKGKIDGEVSTRIGLGTAGQIFSSVQGSYQPNDLARLTRIAGGGGPGRNNPGNMRIPGGAEFQSFPSMEAGFSAMEKQLKLYYNRDGLTSLSQMLSKWAPKGDGKNDPTAYASFVAKKVGIGPNDNVNVNDPALMQKITHAMATMEHGPNYMTKAAGNGGTLPQLLQQYNGDIARSLAAFKVGPSAVNAAIKQVEVNQDRMDRSSGRDSSRDFLAYLPKDVQQYVKSTETEFANGGGSAPMPTLQDLHQAARSNPSLADNPRRLRIAIDELTRLHEDSIKAKKQREEDSTAEALRVGMKNGYRISAIPQSILANVPPDKLDNVRNTLSSLAKGDGVDNPLAYQKMTSAPGLLSKMSEAEWFSYSISNFTPETKKHFDNERAKLIGAVPGSNGPGELNTSAIKSAVDERLRMMKIDPTPKDDGGNDAARVGTLRKIVNDSVLSAQRESGKKFNSAEVSTHIDKLFAQNVELHSTLFGFKTGNASMPLLSMAPGDVPFADKDAIKQSFKNIGVANPTDAQILEIYLKKKLKR